MTSTCPACRTPLGPTDARCPHCGLLLVGPVAAELGAVDRELEALGERRRLLLAHLRQETVPPPRGVPGSPPGAPPVGLPADRRPSWSVQQVLLGLGVLLVVVAGLVFVAVSWRTLGVAGQVAVVAGAAVAACLASRFLERRGLGTSAEAAAVLGGGLIGVGLVAARSLGLADLDAVDRFDYTAGAAAVLAVLCTAAGVRSASRSWGVVAVVAAVTTVAAGLRAADPGWLAYALVLPLGGAALAALALVPPRWLRFRGPARVGAGVLVVAGWWVAPLAALDDAAPAVPSAAVGLAAAAVVLLLLARRHGVTSLWTLHRTVSVVTVVAASVQLVAAASLQPVGVRVALAVAAGAVLVVTAARAGDLRERWAGVAAGVATTTLPLVTLDLLLRLDAGGASGWGLLAPLTRDAAWVSVLVVAVVWFVVALLVGRCRPAWRPAAHGVAALALLGGTAVATATTDPAPLVVALSAVATVVAVRAYRSPWPDEGLLLLVVVLGELAAFAVALATEDVVPAAGVLAAAGVVALAYGFRPGREPLWWVGAAAASAGSWLWLAEREVETAEAFSLPLAGLCLLAGGLGRLRRPGLSSWAVAGPALTAGLVPSAVVSVDDEGLLRPLLLLAVGAALLLVGVWRRWQALVVLPALALAVVAVSQLAPYAVGLPRWLSLGAVGVLLLVVGVRYDARRRDVVAAARWVRGLR